MENGRSRPAGRDLVISFPARERAPDRSGGPRALYHCVLFRPDAAVHARRSAERPAKRAASPNSSSILISWLYFAVRSERESEPVLI